MVKAAAAARLRRIEGRHNPLLKELRAGFARAEPTSGGYCAIEGLRTVEEAIRSGLRFHAVFFADSALSLAERLLSQLSAHTDTLLVPDKLFAASAPTESPQGVAALVLPKKFTLQNILDRAAAGPIVALAGIQDPGNLGTIVRSAEAFGAAGVLLGTGTVSQFNAKVIRASAGSMFRMPSVRADLGQILPKLRERGIRIYGTSSHRGVSLPESNLSPPLALMIGSEGGGVARDLIALADETIVVPHAPQVESLNAGVAASLLLYECSRQMARHSSQG